MASGADSRCGVLAATRGDEMLGTAFPAGRVFLVEQPGSWGPSGLTTSQFSPPVANQLVNRLARQGIRTLTIRRPGRQERNPRRQWGYADCRPGHRGVVWGDFGADEELLAVDPVAALVAGGVAEPAYLVCAHGTHDVCCAIEGRPVAAALNAVRPGQVWECSHVGGDRFAANVLTLPSGQLYGRVSPADAGEVAAATTAGRVLPDLLRGRIGMPPPAQVAMVRTARDLSLLGLDDITLLSLDVTGPGPVVRLATPTEIVTVTLTVHVAAPQKLTCRGVGLARARYYDVAALVREPALAS